MEHRKFSPSGNDVSLLGMGCMRLPTLGKEDEIDYPLAKKMIDDTIAGGVTYFDTAYGYHGGKSEEFVGQAFADIDRTSYTLASKMPVFLLKEAADIPRIFEEQLQRCRTTYFDYYLLHALDAASFEKAERLKVYEYLTQQKQAGRIRHLGFSFHDAPEVLTTICAAHSWDFAQIQLNYLDWENYRSREQYEVLEKHNIPCIVMEPVHGGSLASLSEEADAVLQKAAPGKSIASWALRFAASLPNVVTVLSGMSTVEQVKDNLATFNAFTPLSDAERETLTKALTLYQSDKAVPCTNCKYCMPCPAGVNIPGIFALYNNGAHALNIELFKFSYNELPAEEKANHCTECGQCTTACPQHLNIPTLLARIEAGKEPMQPD